MAKDAKSLSSKIPSSEDIDLNTEMQDMRMALREQGRDDILKNRNQKKESSLQTTAEISVALKKMETLCKEQQKNNDQTVKELRALLASIEEQAISISEIQTNAISKKSVMQHLIMDGIVDAQEHAAEAACSQIEDIANEAENHIRVLERESMARAKGLFKITLPKKLYEWLKWLIMTSVLILLAKVIFYGI